MTVLRVHPGDPVLLLRFPMDGMAGPWPAFRSNVSQVKTHPSDKAIGRFRARFFRRQRIHRRNG